MKAVAGRTRGQCRDPAEGTGARQGERRAGAEEGGGGGAAAGAEDVEVGEAREMGAAGLGEAVAEGLVAAVGWGEVAGAEGLAAEEAAASVAAGCRRNNAIISFVHASHSTYTGRKDRAATRLSRGFGRALAPEGTWPRCP